MHAMRKVLCFISVFFFSTPTIATISSLYDPPEDAADFDFENDDWRLGMQRVEQEFEAEIAACGIQTINMRDRHHPPIPISGHFERAYVLWNGDEPVPLAALDITFPINSYMMTFSNPNGSYPHTILYQALPTMSEILTFSTPTSGDIARAERWETNQGMSVRFFCSPDQGGGTRSCNAAQFNRTIRQKFIGYMSWQLCRH